MLIPFKQRNRQIAVWLVCVAVLVWLMAMIGAVTRLTESGLSMVEWRPVVGVLPPLSEAEWNRVFELYRQTPEFRVYNNHMDLSGFKTIFFWEWLHRLWGHLIALSFALPFLWFAARRAIPAGLTPRLLGLFALGGLQGGAGWFMVLSGLADRPEVSHYRLALHLLLAALIFALLLTTAWRLVDPGLHPQQIKPAARLRPHAVAALGLTALTMVWGAFVAGLDAGLAYNTFPDMAGHWIPPEIANLSPWWLNGLENTAGVQFIHRWLAPLTAVVVPALCFRVWRGDFLGPARALAAALAVTVTAQVGLGIATLLSGVHIVPAAAHQGGAFLTLGLLALLTTALSPKPQP